MFQECALFLNSGKLLPFIFFNQCAKNLVECNHRPDVSLTRQKTTCSKHNRRVLYFQLIKSIKNKYVIDESNIGSILVTVE